MKDKVSIIIPAFNQGNYLNETLKSIYYQTYENWECLIINDGSIDNTHDIAIEWYNKDSRFIYEFQVNQGLSAARNRGLRLASGDFIQFLDADDLIDKNRFEICFEIIKTYDLDGVISNFIMLDNNSQITSPFCDLKTEYLEYESILFDWDSKFSIPIHCGLFKKDLFANFSFPDSLRAKEDWIMWIFLFQKKPKFEFVDEPLSIYRKNNQGMTKDWIRMTRERLNAILYLENSIENEYFVELIKRTAIQNTNDLIKIKSSYLNLKSSWGNRLLEAVKKTSVTSIYTWFKS